ncbi:MAG: DUF1016 family protein [Treponema sp.]|nr:DUF1016 family protein [Treponema sp.]
MLNDEITLVHSHDASLDEDYIKWISDVKKRFRAAQIKTAIKVNSEQLLFNWQLGRDLVMRRAEEKWGSGIVEQVSLDLQNEFPNAKGFGTSNLWSMKKWYLFYNQDVQKVQQLVGEFEKSATLNNIKLQQVGAEIKEENVKVHQVGGELAFPSIFAYVPWRHHVEIITKCKSIDEAFFYIQKTIEEGLSRNALQNYMKAGLFKQAGKAITNYAEKLPLKQAQLANEITKDTYDFGFVSLPADYDETSLEAALEQNIGRFLLELGTGFAFIGRQKEIIVAGKSRKMDMLFYHAKLHCYIVVELKVVPFEPEFAGKLNFYVNAVNDLIKAPEDNPTIGLLICKGKNSTEVKWAFQGIETPMGVASYDNVQIKEIEKQLPTAEQIQQRMELMEKEFLLK